jgi:hypothetical protein
LHETCSIVEQVYIDVQDCASRRKFMLTRSVLDTLQEAAGLATIAAAAPNRDMAGTKAANAHRYDLHASQVRRSRRMRRAERNEARSLGGWTARLW